MSWCLAATVGVLFLYLALLRPRHVRWGATDEELARVMPGDALVPHPNFLTTRALAIRARPEDVWPWIAQLGAGRGGYYSYDKIEQLLGMDVHSADRILSEIPPLAVGDTLPAGRLALVVREAAENSHLLVVGETPSGPLTRCTALYPMAGEGTRLVTRSRWRCNASPRMLLAYALQDVGGFLMVRRMLFGLKARAERLAAARRAAGH